MSGQSGGEGRQKTLALKMANQDEGITFFLDVKKPPTYVRFLASHFWTVWLKVSSSSLSSTVPGSTSTTMPSTNSFNLFREILRKSTTFGGWAVELDPDQYQDFQEISHQRPLRKRVLPFSGFSLKWIFHQNLRMLIEDFLTVSSYKSLWSPA